MLHILSQDYQPDGRHPRTHVYDAGRDCYTPAGCTDTLRTRGLADGTLVVELWAGGTVVSGFRLNQLERQQVGRDLLGESNQGP